MAGRGKSQTDSWPGPGGKGVGRSINSYPFRPPLKARVPPFPALLRPASMAPRGRPVPPPRLWGPISSSVGLRAPGFGHVGGGAVFPGAAIAAGLVVDLGLGGERVVGDGELGGLQALDLVAQARGDLEVEIGGGLAHALLEVGQRGLDVVADQRAFLGDAGVDADVVALVDAFEDVADVALDAFRRDAVGHRSRPAASRGGGWSRRWRAPSSRSSGRRRG